jgi:hypothetical protein
MGGTVSPLTHISSWCVEELRVCLYCLCILLLLHIIIIIIIIIITTTVGGPG